MTRRGLFISLEGTEGCGKTTQMSLLVEHLRREGFSVVENKEPGSTKIGTKIRQILLDPTHQEMAPITELLLMFASRTQAVKEVIHPALERGDIVVSDRFTDSTLAYQGEARGLGFEIVRKAHQLALGSLQPDLTLYLEIDVEAGLKRAHQRNENAADSAKEERIDRHSLDFHRRVREGYNKIAMEEPARFHKIDGSGTPEAVAERIWNEVSALVVTTR